MTFSDFCNKHKSCKVCKYREAYNDANCESRWIKEHDEKLIDEFAKTLIEEPPSLHWDFCDMVKNVAKRLKEKTQDE